MSTRTLDDRRDRLRELTDDVIPRIRREIDDLDDEIADAIADGQEPNGLRKKRDRRRRRLEDLERTVPRIERNLAEAEVERLRDEAAERLASVKKIAGGIAGEVPRRIAEARELADRLIERLSWLATRSELLRRLGVEADVLAGTFDLDRPEIRSVADLDENPESAARDVVQRVRRETRRVRSVPGMSRRQRIADLPAIFDVETPTPALLDRLAELTDGDGEG